MPGDGKVGRLNGKSALYIWCMVVAVAGLLLALTGIPMSSQIALKDGGLEQDLSESEISIKPSGPSILYDKPADAVAPKPEVPLGSNENSALKSAPSGEQGLIDRVVTRIVGADESDRAIIGRCDQIRSLAEKSCHQALFSDQDGPVEQCIARELRYTLWSTYGCD